MMSFPRAESVATSVRRMSDEATSSPEFGSSRTITVGSWRSAAEIRIFYRIPFEKAESGA